jgi:CRP-like cAMP-binding protein
MIFSAIRITVRLHQNHCAMNFNISRYHFNTESILDGLAEEHLKKLGSQMQRIERKKGEIIFKKGEESKGVYILKKGKIKIYQINQDGRPQILYIYKKDESFGYKPLLCRETHPITAEALEDSVISFIPKGPFFEVLKVSPQLSNRLLFNLSHEFTVWVNTTTAFAQQTVKERFALTLLILNEKYKKKGSKKPTELNLSREDLACYVGTAVETLIRILREFKDKKILEVKGRKIKIIDAKALMSLTEFY